MSKVYLIGAGPGDARLITVKGMEQLKKCDAVIYDYLAAEELLTYVKPECEKIYVGKQAGRHSKKQEEINAILLECAKRYKVVVRLKGGDPFVFGRGGEEVEALQQNGIAFEVIPGVTSAVSVAECAGIPVTHRGVARSFHVITGHTRQGKESSNDTACEGGCPRYDYDTIAKLEGTLVFLMGLANLKGITQELINAGKDTKTPAAVISKGTTICQQMVKGTLEDIADKVRREGLVSPGVIVIGDTAAYDFLYHPPNQRLVGITATDELRKKLEKGLEEMDWKGVSLCRMEVRPQKDMDLLRKELKQLDQYSWIVFTSQNGVHLFFEQVRKGKFDYRLFAKIKFAVLGSGTESCLMEYGFVADFVPSKYTIDTLCQELIPKLSKEDRILIPRALQGSKELTSCLQQENIIYKELAIYDVQGSLTEQVKALEQLDYLVFVSASGVTTFFDEVEKRGVTLPSNIRIACIGQITERCVRRRFRQADIIATKNNVEGLLNALMQDNNI